MVNLNLTDLSEHGVTDILLNFRAYDRYNQTQLETFIGDAKNVGIKTHIWAQIFFASQTGWVKPVINGTFNQDFFDKKILELEKYANISGIAGINFDYLRFSGSVRYNNSASQNPNGTEAISEFVRQATERLHEINPDLILSAALMPEFDRLVSWYGDNYTVISNIWTLLHQ